MTRRGNYILLVGLAWGLMACQLMAQPDAQTLTPDKNHAGDVRFRKVLVPQSEITRLAHGYMPMKRDEFRQLLKRLQAEGEASTPNATRIESAWYYASLQGDVLTNGLALFEVIHAGTDLTPLWLGPSRMGLGPASWRNTQQPATTGVDMTGRFVARVKQSGTLVFSWTLQGVQGARQEVQFSLPLAQTPRNYIVLDLPADNVVTARMGLVTQLDKVARPPTSPGIRSVPTPIPALSPGRNRWLIQSGGLSHIQLSIIPRDAAGRRQQLVDLQQNTLYDLAEDGLGIQTDLRLGAGPLPVSTLVLEVDAEIELTSIRSGGIDVPWTSLPNDGHAVRHVAVHLEAPLEGDARSLQITGVAQLRTDSPWNLPGIRLTGASWRQATMAIRLSESIELCQLTPINAFPMRVESSSDDASEELRTFQLVASDGTLQVVVRRRSTRVAATIDTVIGVSSGTLTARIVGELRCEFGRRFAIDATIPIPWTVDGIETEPANVIEDYRFIGRSTGAKHLQIRLAKPLTPEHSLRFIVRAHRVSSSTLRADSFRPIYLLDVASTSRRVSIVPARTYRLDLSGDASLVQLDPGQIDTGDAQRTQPYAGSLAFVDDDRADLLQIKITRENPAFSALIHVDAEVSSNRLTESYRIVCRPDSVPVTRLLIHLSESRESELHWTLDPPDGSILRARQLAENEPLRSPSNNSGETWELVLREPRANPFEIKGRRESHMTDALPVALPALPAATSQEAWLTVRSTGGAPLSIDARSVRATPPKPMPADCVHTVLASYRYDPSQKARVTLDHIKQLEGRSPVWAWQASLLSRYDRRGRIIHRMIYQVENTGRSSFALQIPAGFTMRSIEIDGKVAAESVRTGKDRTYTIPLLPEKRFARVEIVYQGDRPVLGIIARLHPALPVTQIPVLNRRWTVWLPVGFQTMAGNPTVWPAVRNRIDWKQRLLGPLAAPLGQAPFHPFSANVWRSLAGNTDRTKIAPAHLFLQRLGKCLQNLKTQPASSTWRTLLRQYTHQLDQSHKQGLTPLWIDASLLANDGFSVDQALPATGVTRPMQMAASVLSKSNLVVVVRENTLLLTSQVGLAHYFHSVQPTENPTVATVTTGSELAHQLDRLPLHPRPGFLSVRAWISEPAVPTSPWRVIGSPTSRRPAGEPRQVCDVLLQPDDTSTLTIYQPGAFRAMGFGVLLAAAGIAILLVRYASRILPPILIMLSVIAMLVPGFLVPISSSLILGMLAGIVGTLAARTLPLRNRNANRSSDEPVTIVTVGATGAVILLLLVVQTSTAQEPEGKAAADSAYRVLVPVDEYRKPVGQYDYLPMKFYEIIHRSGARGSQAREGSLIRSASYLATFNWRRQHSALNLTSLSTLYQLEVFRANQWVELPWSRDVEHVEILEARIGGEPTELVWNSDHTTFSVLVTSPGMAKLELVLRPVINETPDGRKLNFPIPRIPQSTLRIEAPADAVGIEVPSALGTFFLDIDSGALEYQLGPTQSLQINWPADSGVAEVSPMEIEQLMWLHLATRKDVSPVVVDSKITLRRIGGHSQQVTLLADRTLQLLPLTTAQQRILLPPIVHDGKQRTMVFRLKKPAASELTLHLQFKVIGVTEFGHIRLPYLGATEGRITRRWLAVSASPSIDVTPSTSADVVPLDGAEFLTRWGQPEMAPQLTYQLLDAEPMWYLSTRPRPPQTDARQHLDVRLDRTSIDWSLQADLVTSQGRVFQHRLRVPADVTIESAAVIQDDTNMVAHAFQDRSGVVTVFLNRGVEGPHRLEFRGHQPRNANQKRFTLPVVSLLDANLVEETVNIYRSSEVLVDVKPNDNWHSVRAADVGRFRESFGRLVAAYDITSEHSAKPSATSLVVRRNHPRVDTRLVTTLRRAKDQWEAEALLTTTLDPKVPGVLDTLRLEIPASWSGPFTVTPAMSYKIRPLPDQRKNHLVLTPDQPVSDRITLTIHSPLKMSENERVSTPDIIPLDAAKTQRFFVLPTRLNEQRIGWKTRGLQPIAIRDVLPTALAEPTYLIAYRVWARFRAWSKPRAVIVDVQRVANKKQISLAEVFLDKLPGNRFWGTTVFQLEPAGTASCTLTIPDQIELVHVRVDDVPAILSPLANHKWQVLLGPDQLPQQVTVVFQSKQPDGTDSFQLETPWIDDFDVKQTLWTVYAMGGDSWRVLDKRADPISQLRQTTIRLGKSANLIKSTSEILLDNPLEEVTNWYTPWAIQLATTIAHATRLQQTDTAGKPAESDSVSWAEIENQQALIAKRLKVEDVWKKALGTTIDTPQAEDLFQTSCHPASSAVGHAVNGAAPNLAAMPAQSEQSLIGSRLISAWGIGLLGLALVWLCRRTQIVTRLTEWPQIAGLLLGVAWWLFCIPSWLGCVIIILSLYRLAQRLLNKTSPQRI